MRKQIITLFWCVSLVAACALDVTAHPPEDHEPGHAQRTELPKGLVLPATTGPHPWSDKPVLSDPNRFQIAIMTDRTGGHRPGVWMKAVESVNLLRPDFVMSVGDLIEGYTEDPEQVEREWQEFLGFIDQMEMKFFFVGGNHDLTNPMMHEKWRKHFGPEWYSFDYNGVHFICLCSEDPNFRIGDTQMNWLKADLEKSATARWTLVFLHKPLWFISERYRSFGMQDSTNWPEVEKLLHGRRHTVFAGHTHHYAQFHRNGATYYQLATTGGGSQLRGIPYGEFDHIMWLTMEKEGPYVANLLLDGIVPGDRVTEETLARFRTFLAKAKLEVAPILLGQGEGLSEGQIDIRLINEFDAPVRVSGR
ncbi:MAG TPA: metallophosphoesterase, partial [Pirellulales bacterium]|nr:metallophosphoesterase [Pirellulales bacterium]